MINVQYDDVLAEKYGGMNAPIKQHIITPLLLRMVGDVRGLKVADLACGTGHYSRMLAQRGASKVVGVDISPAMIEIAEATEKKNPLGITYSVADVAKLSLQEKFDLVTGVYLFNYATTMDELADMMWSACDLLKPNGRCCAIIPHWEMRPESELKYGRSISNSSGLPFFCDGEEMAVTFEGGDGSPFSIKCYFWSDANYAYAMHEGGFKEMVSVEPRVSPEGIAQYGRKYWNGFLENPSTLGIILTK